MGNSAHSSVLKYTAFDTIIHYEKVKVKEARYMPGVAQRVPGS